MTRPKRTQLVLNDMAQARLLVTLRRIRYVMNYPKSEQREQAIAELDALIGSLSDAT